MEHLIRSVQDDVKDIREDVKDLGVVVRQIERNGCAKREGDMIYMKSLHDQHAEFRADLKKLMYSSVGSLVTILVLTVAFLLKYVLFR